MQQCLLSQRRKKMRGGFPQQAAAASSSQQQQPAASSSSSSSSQQQQRQQPAAVAAAATASSSSSSSQKQQPAAATAAAGQKQRPYINRAWLKCALFPTAKVASRYQAQFAQTRLISGGHSFRFILRLILGSQIYKTPGPLKNTTPRRKLPPDPMAKRL